MAEVLQLQLKCPLCHGKGTTPCMVYEATGSALWHYPCAMCKGTGFRPAAQVMEIRKRQRKVVK